MRTTQLKTFSLLLLWTRSYVIKEKEKKTSFFELVIALWNSNLNLARATKF